MTDVVVVVHFPFRCRFIAPVFASHVLIQYSIKWIHLTNMLRSWPSWWTCPFRCRFIAPGHCCTRSYAIFNSIHSFQWYSFNIWSCGRRHAFVPFDVGSSLRDIPSHVHMQYSIIWFHLNCILWICDGRGRRDAFAPFDVGSSLRDITPHIHMQYSNQSLISITFFEYVMDVVVVIHFNDQRCRFTEVEKGISFAFRFSPWQQRLIANGF